MSISYTQYDCVVYSAGKHSGWLESSSFNFSINSSKCSDIRSIQRYPLLFPFCLHGDVPPAPLYHTLPKGTTFQGRVLRRKSSLVKSR